MSAKNKNLSEHKIETIAGASKFKIAIVVSEYNEKITFALRDGAIEILKKYGVKEKNIFVELTPGAYELPLAAKWMYEKKKADAVICKHLELVQQKCFSLLLRIFSRFQ